MNKSSKWDFFSFMDEIIQGLCRNEQIGTAQNYSRARKSFALFLQKERISFSEVTEEKIMAYELWLKKRNVVRNTSSFYMRILRATYNKATIKKIAKQNYPFKYVYTGIDKTRKRAVDKNLFWKLSQLELVEESALDLCRDLFQFSIYARGMAFVDLAYLKKSCVKGDFLIYTRCKTGQQLEIKIERCMQQIINKYAKKVECSEYLFPIINETIPEKAHKQYQNKLCYYNKLLKKLAKMIGADETITSYVSRHTWATIARNNNIPISVISAGMGHSSEKTTLIYLASMETSIIDNANKMIIEMLHSNVKKQAKSISY